MTKKALRLLVALGLFFMTLQAANSAMISRVCEERGGGFSHPVIICKVMLRGEIVKGDASRLRNLLQSDKQVYETGVLILDSPGGDVAEAKELSRLMSEWFGSATVRADGVCASACFLVWVSSPIHGSDNAVGEIPRIGLHRPFFSQESYSQVPAQQANAAQIRIMRETRDFLQQHNVSQRLIDEMMRRPSNDVYWLTRADLDELRALSPYMEELFVAECGHKKESFDPLASSEIHALQIREMWKVVACQEAVLKKRRPAQLLTN